MDTLEEFDFLEVWEGIRYTTHYTHCREQGSCKSYWCAVFASSVLQFEDIDETLSESHRALRVDVRRWYDEQALIIDHESSPSK